jgi:hypothetical protein
MAQDEGTNECSWRRGARQWLSVQQQWQAVREDRSERGATGGENQTSFALSSMLVVDKG